MKANVTATIKQAAILCAAGILFFTSCTKDHSTDNNDSTTVTEQEAVDVMTAGVSAESGGLAEQTDNAARVAAESSRIGCGQTIDTTYAGQNQPGAVITYNYSVHVNRSLVCNAGVPQKYNFALDGHSVYSTPRMSSDDNTTASFTIEGFQPGSSVYTFNQQYERNGTQQSKVRQQRTFTSKLVITSTDVKVDKSTRMIISGTAAVQLSGTVSGGKTVNFSGTLTFLGNRKGLLTLGNGNTYNIQW
ncbi:MAG: hypothetical protein DI535_08505 [Citrobacter freundii]|nr:MAG: hypothetical protein DI535_08505 [Citrobacter freundii]